MKKLIQNHKGGIITDRKSLKKREKDFCREYVYCGNPKDAAQRAGYTVFPEMCGIRLLTEKRIKDEIAELEGKLALQEPRRFAVTAVLRSATFRTL